MNEAIEQASRKFIQEQFEGVQPSDIGRVCKNIESEKAVLAELLGVLETKLKPEDFVLPTHQPNIFPINKPIEVLGSQSHDVICINYNVRTTDGKIDPSLTEVNLSLGGDPFMTMFLLNLLGHNTALSALVGNDKMGEIYTQAAKQLGVNMITTKRDTEQPIQFNISVDGNRAGSICLYDAKPVSKDTYTSKLNQFTICVNRSRALKYVLLGGAPAGEDIAENRIYFGKEIPICRDRNIRTGGDPKDKLRGDGLAALMRADDFKPNHNELVLIWEWVYKGLNYDNKFRKEARNNNDYLQNPTKAVKLYHNFLEDTTVDPKQIWIPSLAHKGALLLQGRDIYKLSVKDMTDISRARGGSAQGAGNGAWAGYIHAYLKYGLNPEKLLKEMGAGGMASCLWPGNLGGTPSDMDKYRRYARVEKI